MHVHAQCTHAQGGSNEWNLTVLGWLGDGGGGMGW